MLAAVLLVGMLLSTPRAAGPMRTVGGFPGFNFQLVNELSGMCATVAGGSTAVNNYAVQYYCDLDPSRLWESEMLENGPTVVSFANYNSGLCLAPAGGLGGVNVPLVSVTCNTYDPEDDQAWVVVASSSESEEWKNFGTGLCMATTGVDKNAELVQVLCDASNPADVWYRSLGDYVGNAHSGLCLAPAGDDRNDSNVAIVQNPCTTGRTWRLLATSFGYEIDNNQEFSAARQCLAPTASSREKNAGISQYTCDGNVYQSWYLISVGNSEYELQNAASDMCLSPAGGVTSAGASIVQYWCDGDPSREWWLEWAEM